MAALIARMNGTKVEYLKAHPKSNDLPKPEVGKGYVFCGIYTSPVVSFEVIDKGYFVKTTYSEYRCWIGDMENAASLAKLNNLPEPVFHVSGAVYWDFDSRPSTYKL